MGDVHVLINNMTGGVVTDELSVRSDWDNYKKSMRRVTNFYTKPFGGAYRRFGSEMLGKMKFIDKRVRLVPFIRANYDTFILEFGHLYMRVWRDYAQLMNGANPYEVTTPYTADDLDKMQWLQINDVMYIVDGTHKPQKLSRSGTVASPVWTIADYAPTADPWTGTDFPSAVTIFRERLVMANTPAYPQKMWMSKVGDFENFTETASEDTSALILNMTSEMVAAIRWMTNYQDKLYIGTHSTVHTLEITDTSRNITVKNFRFNQQQAFGCRPISGRQVGQALLFVKRDGRGLIELLYEQATGTMNAQNRNLTAPQMAAGKIKEFGWQQNPFSQVWCSKEDGTLSALTYLREHNVFAWSEHILGANCNGAFVESMCVLPSRSEDVDDVYFVVKRKMNGQWVRFLEVIKGVADENEVQQEKWNYLDCNKLFTFNTPTKDVNVGLEYEGETLAALADGYVVDGSPLVVTGGKITLPRAASTVRVGYNYESIGETLPIDAGGQMGSAQGVYKRIVAIRLHLFRSLGGWYGSADKLKQVFTYKSGVLMGTAPPPETGVKEKTFPAGWEREATVVFKQDQPLPFNIQAIGLDLQTNG